MKELGLFIKAAREHLTLTVRQAEELSGISNAYLSQIETGKIKKPSPAILHKLSRLYHVPYEMLMEKAGHPVPDFGYIPEGAGDHCIKLLIVDDSPIDRELIKIHLANDPDHIYSIYEAETGEEALEMLADHATDCVLLDYQLPDIDGLEVFNKMKKNLTMRDTSVIILTGYGNEETAVKALHMGAVNYLNKNSISRDILVTAILNGLKRNKIREAFKMRMLDKRKKINYLYDSVNAITVDIKSAFERLNQKNTYLQYDPDAVFLTARLNELHAFTSQKTADDPSPQPGQKGDQNE